MVLQQLSGTTLPSATLDEMYTLITQSWELLLPQHLNWRGGKRRANGFGFNHAAQLENPKPFIFLHVLSHFILRLNKLHALISHLPGSSPSETGTGYFISQCKPIENRTQCKTASHGSCRLSHGQCVWGSNLTAVVPTSCCSLSTAIVMASFPGCA